MAAESRSTDAGWDDAVLAAWRQEAGYAGLIYIELLPGKPKLAFDLSGAVQLITEGRLPNWLLYRGKELLVAEASIYEAATADDPADTTQARFWEHHQEVMRWQDEVIACAWASPPNPPWCRFADLPAGGRPPGQFCLHDIQPPARRRMLVDLIIAGSDGLATFREQSAVLAAASDGTSLRPAAEQLPDADATAASAVLVRRSGVSERDASGIGGADNRARRLVRIPWEPDAPAEGHAHSVGA